MKISSASLAEQDAVIAVVVAAFLTDPIARWMFPEPHQYFAAGGDVTRAFAGHAFANGSAYYVDGFAGAALWLPPGIHPDEDALSAVFKRTVAEHRQENAFSLFEQMGNSHPEEAHWYLPQIGVDPIQQGRGYGSALMKHALLRCDREKKLASNDRGHFFAFEQSLNSAWDHALGFSISTLALGFRIKQANEIDPVRRHLICSSWRCST